MGKNVRACVLNCLDKIINDNLTKFHMVLESLGVQLLDTRSNNPHFSNIVNF